MFHFLLTQPLFNLLVVLYEFVAFGDLGLAIIALTLLIRLILYPVFYKGLKSQMLMQQMQPEMKRLQSQYKDDKAKQAQEMMGLYKKYGINPFSSIFYTLIQLPILFAVYKIFITGLTPEAMKDLYSFIPAPESLNPLFLNVLDLTQPSWIMVIVATAATFIQSYLMVKQSAAKGTQAPGSKYMMYLAPALTLIFLPSLSAAIGLYWTTTAIFSIFQQMAINKQLHNKQNPA